MEHTINLTVPYIQKIIGESDLSVDEYYDKSEYITLELHVALENPQDVSLVTPIEGVTLKQYKGKGIVKFEPGDILRSKMEFNQQLMVLEELVKEVKILEE